MKKILLSLLISFFIFPLLVLAACDTRSSINEQNANNCSWSGGSWNSTTCTCSCPSGYYSEDGSGGSCISNSYKGSEAQESTFGGDDSSGGSSSGGSSSGGSSSGSTGGNISGPTSSSKGTLSNPIDSQSFEDLLDKIIDWILDIAMVLAPLVIVYGGLVYITAAGDTSKISQAKKIILYAVLGFILALLAKSLIGIFKDLVVK